MKVGKIHHVPVRPKQIHQGLVDTLFSSLEFGGVRVGALSAKLCEGIQALSEPAFVECASRQAIGAV
jgi:hypothetical protein